MLMALALATAAGAQQPSSAAKQPPPHAASSDTAFVTKIAQVGIAEVELGKLANEKAMRDEVKKFGQRMVDDHTKAGDELKALAMKKDITWPADTDAEHKSLHDRLSKMSGAAFDRAYMQAMADGHRKVANEFRKEIKSAKDADVKAWAEKTLPTIEAHLKDAEMINRGVHGSSSTH
jgi:putative membrane protein